jgi:TPR repeat protein
MPIANIAHGAGAILGILTGLAISRPDRRFVATAAALGVFMFGLWGATVGRPHINLSKSEGSEEVRWGFEAVRANRNQEAVKWLRDAVTYQLDNRVYWFNLALAYHRVGNQQATVNALRTAAALGDADAASYLGTIYDRGVDGTPKNEKEAVYWYRKAASSNDPDSLNNLAWAYATSNDPEIHNASAALDLAKKAVDLEKEEPDPDHIDTLAEAYYANGLYEDAVQTERKALGEAAEMQNADLQKDEFEKHLQKYQSALQKANHK